MAKQNHRHQNSEVRRRILDAARAEFMEHGYEDASVNRIIQTAGINKGSLYHYFEDKADLFVTVLKAVTEEMTQSVTELNLAHLLREPPKDFWGFMEHASIKKIAFAIHHPGLTRLGSELFLQAAKPGAPAKFKEYMQTEVHDLMGEFLKVGQAQGAVREDLPIPMLTHIIMAVSEIMNRSLFEDPSLIERFDPEEIRRYSHLQVDMIRRILSVPEGGTPHA
ncbi:MAG TPA: TetR/AcrR family transcriptional regulator [Stenomitos sp.]